MDLIAIVFTVCALAHPDHCEEQRLEYMWNTSLTQCVMTAQPYVAQWIGEHPKWSVKQYHCEYPHAKEKVDAGGSARQRNAFLDKIGTRPVVMGILDVTPEAALAQRSWRCMSAPEPTRPGAAPVAEAEELARIEPILADLARALDVPVSVDTGGLPQGNGP